MGLKVLIFGAGAVGSTFGGFLSRDHEVTLLGRPEHLRALRQKGLTVTGIWGRHHFTEFSFATEVRPLRRENFDLILLTVKAYDTQAAAKQLRSVVGPRTLILSLQNGLGNIEALHKIFPQNKILAGRVIFGAVIPKPGQVKITVMAHPTAIGETSVKRETPRLKHMVRQFKKAGLPVAAAKDIQALLWAKVIYNCALNPLASLLECHYGHLMEKDGTRKMMNLVIGEIYQLARRMKIKFWRDA